jgi:hypothetical protein
MATKNNWGSAVPLEVSKGGLAAVSHTDGSVLFGSGTSAVTNSGELAKGSLLVGDGTTDPTEVVAGTNNQLLFAASGQASGVQWQTFTAANKRTLLETITISNDASITTSGTIDSTYPWYEIQLIDILPATDGTDLHVQFSEAGASLLTSSKYYTQMQGQADKGGLSDGQNVDRLDSAAANGYLSYGNSYTMSNDATEPLHGVITLFSPADSSVNPTLFMKGVGMVSVTQVAGFAAVVGYGEALAIDAVKLFMSSGNLSSGTIKLYGLW